jgi:hypothetical protein
MFAAEMNGVPRMEIGGVKGGNRDHFRLEVIKCSLQTREVCVLGEDREIRVTAKLGRAVKHAGLAAHQKRFDPVPADRGKDFEYRVRDQGCLRVRDRSAISAATRASVPRG